MPNRKARTRTRADGRPDYQIVAEALREKITSGAEGYQVDDYLPSFAEQAEREGLAVSTIQKAIRLLREQGYVESAAGQGTWVISANPQAPESEQDRLNREITRRLDTLEEAVDQLTELLTRRGRSAGHTTTSRRPASE
jgi:DNA-binding GntR family transcriptional regulator